MSAEQNPVLIMNRQPQPILEKYSPDSSAPALRVSAQRQSAIPIRLRVPQKKFNRTRLQERRQMETTPGFEIN